MDRATTSAVPPSAPRVVTPTETAYSWEVMQRIAAPMIGGMITAPLLSMLVIPAAYYLLRRRKA